MIYDLDEGERQATLLAIARLAVERPGWDYMLGEIADKLKPSDEPESFAMGDEVVIVLPDTRRSGRETYATFKQFKREELASLADSRNQK
jgi:hypothetical protein